MNAVAKGQWYRWMGCDCYVMRVAKDWSWADLWAKQATGLSWSKRQKLPLPAEAKLIGLTPPPVVAP